MKKSYLLVALVLSVTMASATNYYVDVMNGSDAVNDGLSVGSAYKTIKKAADLTYAGDTVFIMNGTYGSFNINRSGDATAQIVFTNYPGHLPKIQATASTYALVFVTAGTSYITVNGLELSGWGVNLSLAADSAAAKAQLTCPVVGNPATVQAPLAKYNGGGFTADSRSVGVGSHHLVISNNIVHDCTKEGIAVSNCDYVTIEGNRVYNNSWYTIYGTSGITFNGSYNYDNNTSTYRNIVRNNICYGNRMYVPFYNDCKVTDGNGIILDIPKADYNGRSLVANNICFNNGGSGIHSFKMNHVDMFHNISYLNSASPEINSANIYALQCDDVKIINNIIVARPGKRMNGVNATTNLVYDYNIFFGGSTYELVGPHSIIQDPKFVNPSTDPAVADFHLQAIGLGVNAGDNSNSYPADYAGTPRPFGGTVDIGAYESTYTASAACTGSIASLVLSNGNGNGTGEVSANLFYAPAETKPSVSNQKSRKAIMYPASILTSIPANTAITSLKFRRAMQVSGANTTPSTQSIPANAGFRIYLRNETADQFDATAFDWTTIIPGATNPATLVYGGEATAIIGNAGGWKEIPFQVPFTYSGGSLGVFVEYIQNGNIAGATDINWIYDNAGPQPAYAGKTNGYKSTAASGNTSIGTSLSSSNERRPVVTFGYCASGTLPVTFTTFTAIVVNKNVLLSWSTAAEINNAGFEIQRSLNGIDFKTIGFKASNAPDGNSVISQEYLFTDANPLPGISFYRLLQKDRDGRILYSDIRQITLKENILNSLQISPNPVSNTLNALVKISNTPTETIVEIKDISGQVISTRQQVLQPGNNNLKINVAMLAPGTYLLTVQAKGASKMVSRFIKN